MSTIFVWVETLQGVLNITGILSGGQENNSLLLQIILLSSMYSQSYISYLYVAPKERHLSHTCFLCRDLLT